MTQGSYSIENYENETMARAYGRSLPISVKHATMVCSRIRKKTVKRAKTILQEAIDMKKAIPMTRYNFDRGHKTGIGPGRYLIKTCQEILAIVNSAEKNANQKNLSHLIVHHIAAHSAPRPWHAGRKRRRQMKRAHIEIVLMQGTEEKKETTKRSQNTSSKKVDTKVTKETNVSTTPKEAAQVVAKSAA